MANLKLEFTRSALVAIEPPAKGRDYAYDTVQPGLVLVVTPNVKSFQVYRKISGRPVRVTLGHFAPDLIESRELPKTQANGKPLDPLAYIGNTPRLNVRMARALAVAVSAAMDRGENPSAEKREQRRKEAEELTLRQAFDIYHRDHLLAQGKRKAEKLRDDFARLLGTVEPGQKKPRGQERKKSPGAVDWEKRKLSSLKPADVRKMMSALKDGAGLYAANMAFVLLRAVYRKMAEWKLYDGLNPCDGISKFPEQSRDRFIKADEAPKLFTALAEAPEYFRHFVILGLATGARRSNLVSMRWADLDLTAGLWMIPGAQSKNDKAMVVPLIPAALDVLKTRQGNGSPWVFPANSEAGHIQDPKKQWKALLNRAGLDDLRIHDLRRSLGSWAAINGASLAIIGQALGHRSTDATKVYARLTVDPVRDAMEQASSALFAAGGIQPTAEVVDLAAKRKAKK